MLSGTRHIFWGISRLIQKESRGGPRSNFMTLSSHNRLRRGSGPRKEKCWTSTNWGFFFLRFILLLAALDLHCRARAFSSCSRWGLLFVVGHRLLIVALFRAWVLGHEGFSSYRSWALEHRLTSCGAQAQLLWGRWDLPRPGIKTMSPELAGRLSTTRLPRKPHKFSLKSLKITYKNCKDNF